MKKIVIGLSLLLTYLKTGMPVYAASSEIATYAVDTLQIITLVAASAASLFFVYAGYLYLTSAGKPDALENAKNTLRNTLIGLVIVLAASSIVSVFRGALNPVAESSTPSTFSLTPLTTAQPSDGLTQILIDAVSGFIQNIVESATQPLVDAILGFVVITPSVLTNSVIMQFWLVMLGIVDILFVVVVALLGLHVMSASTFGFEELNVKQLLPRIGLAFLGANTSLFLTDYVIVTCNALVKTVLDSTGGLNEAWIQNAVNPTSFVTGNTPLITLIFLVLFLIMAIVLLLLYISRLIMISLAAVLSPFIFLLWAIPKGADFAAIAVKTYIVTVFTVFVHVVIIQLAASFLTLPEHSENSLISIAVAIGLFATLLKTPSLMMQLVTYTAHNGMVQKLGGQIMNVMTTHPATAPAQVPAAKATAVKTPRKVVNL